MKEYLYTKNTTPSIMPLEHGIGATVVDINGKKYIDCSSQTLNLNLGQCHPDVVLAVTKQINKLTFASTRFSCDVVIQLIEKLIEISPQNLNKVNLNDLSGSSANENAIKAIKKYTGKSHVISLNNSHLGQTFETMKISGKYWDYQYLKERNVFFLQAPYCYRCPFKKNSSDCNVECLDELEIIHKQKKDLICGIIVELVMVDAGVIVPPIKYHKRLKEICDVLDIPLVYDEIQTGFGWVGTMFAMEYYQVTPDIYTIGKGFGAGFPLAATIFTEKYNVLEYGEHGLTYGSHPVSCAASLAMIGYLEKSGLVEAREKSVYILERLTILKNKYKIVGDIRNIGLIFGIELIGENKIPNSDATKLIYQDLLDNGVFIRKSNVGANSNVLQFKPPIVITYSEIDYVLEKLDFVFSKYN